MDLIKTLSHKIIIETLSILNGGLRDHTTITWKHQNVKSKTRIWCQCFNLAPVIKLIYAYLFDRIYLAQCSTTWMKQMSTMIRTQTSITLTEAQQYSALYWITIEQVIDFLVMKGNTNSCGLLTSGSSDIIVVLKKGIQMCFNYFRFVCRIFSNKYVAHSESFQCSCSFFMKIFQLPVIQISVHLNWLEAFAFCVQCRCRLFNRLKN